MRQEVDAFHDGDARTWTPHDDLPAYAVGLLDVSELSEFEAHLPDCAQCQQELPGLILLGELLPRSLDPVNLPNGARDRLLERARSEAAGPAIHDVPSPERAPETVVQVDEPLPPRRAALEPIPATRPPQRPRQKRIKLASLGWAAALLFVLASGLFVGVWSATGPHASLPVEIQARLPGGRILPLAGTSTTTAKARLLIPNDGRIAELAVDRLPALNGGRVYQVWFTHLDAPSQAGGTFSVDARGNAVAQVTLPGPSEQLRTVMVTEEPAPGSPSPTGPRLLGWPAP